MLSQFELEIPETLDEALGYLANGNGATTVPLAGGTNLIVDIRARRETPETMVWLGKVPGLRGIEAENGQIRIGGSTTVSEILCSSQLSAAGASLVESARVFGGQMVRNAATVAGNIACGSPAADLVPPLMALDAQVTLKSVTGARAVKLDEYFTGYKEDVRRKDELITEIRWKRPEPSSVNTFYKLGRRKGDAITVTGVAVSLAAAKGRCTRARIALGAVAPVVIRARQAESMLEGEALSAPLIEAAARQAAEESSPIDDVRASAEYRIHTVEVLTRRLVTQAWDGLG
jgi:CO/xanthine dehydrogenase FAD-binding subunit